MNSSMNLHRVTSIKAVMQEANGHKWTDLTFTTEDGGRFSLAVHSKDWLPIEGSGHINHVMQEVSA